MTPQITIQELQRALGGDISRGKNGPQVLCPGPGHSLRDRSLAVALSSDNEDGFIVTSFANDDWQTCKAYVRDKLRLPPFKRKTNGAHHPAANPSREVKAYNYVSETGELLFQVVRYQPKRFRQRRPDGRGGWSWSMGGVRRVLYQLPNVIEALASDKPVFIVEGEKDADTLWRLSIPATCNPGGAGKWKDNYSQHFAGARVFIIPDKDAPGAAHAATVAASIRAIGGQAHIVPLPAKDASDWMTAGGTPEELYRLADLAIDVPHPPSEPTKDHAGQAPKLEFLDPSTWSDRPVPPRRWLVSNRIPLGVPTMLNGDGAAGKTTIALQLIVATARGTDWLGRPVDAPGSVIFFSAEEDADEVHRRLAAILEHQGIGFGDLSGVHLLCMPGDDPVLGRLDKAAGIIRATPLFERLLTAATEIRPSLIVIEAAADVFAGNENDRSQVRQFISLLRRLAMASGAAVLLISHPSLTGMSSGTGTSGSTGWNNSVRSRLYFTGLKAKHGDEAAPDLRELRVMKSNYGPAGEIVRLRWQQGVFVPQGSGATLARVAAEAEVDQAYLDCLDAVHGRSQQVGPYTGKAYAPPIFEKMAQAKGYRAKALTAAQERLFNAGRIEVVKMGPPSKSLDRIVRKAPSV
jgi:RecA-family ATPase